MIWSLSTPFLPLLLTILVPILRCFDKPHDYIETVKPWLCFFLSKISNYDPPSTFVPIRSHLISLLSQSGSIKTIMFFDFPQPRNCFTLFPFPLFWIGDMWITKRTPSFFVGFGECFFPPPPMIFPTSPFKGFPISPKQKTFVLMFVMGIGVFFYPIGYFFLSLDLPTQFKKNNGVLAFEENRGTIPFELQSLTSYDIFSTCEINGGMMFPCSRRVPLSFLLIPPVVFHTPAKYDFPLPPGKKKILEKKRFHWFDSVTKKFGFYPNFPFMFEGFGIELK